MKTIEYDPKITNASTQYNKISDTDMAYLQGELVKYLSLMGELSKSRNRDIQNILNQYWRKRSQTLPKGKDGWNTPESFVSGLLNNTMFGTQNDLSDIQMDALTNISSMMENIADAVSNLNLQPNTTMITTINFRQKLFEFATKI